MLCHYRNLERLIVIVTPIAHTVLDLDMVINNLIPTTPFADRLDDVKYGNGMDELGEFAGRACYQAWNMPNPETANNAGYLSNIQSQGHYSVLEHSSVTFYVQDVSRAMLLELERHRHISFSVESQRYVNTRKAHAKPVQPPAFPWSGKPLSSMLEAHYEQSLDLYDYAYKSLRDEGASIKEAREAARAFLPNATPVDFVVTGNLRAWRDVLGKRWHVAADAEIRKFAGEVLTHLQRLAPNSVSDLPDVPFSY